MGGLGSSRVTPLGGAPRPFGPGRPVQALTVALSSLSVRWLSLDVGAKRVGVAISDASERVVTPLASVGYRGPEALAELVAALVSEREVGGVVVGLPVTRGGAGKGEARVAAVAAALQHRLVVPVELVDERGSTREAEALLAEAGAPRRRWEALVDSLAARVILERYLVMRGWRCDRKAVDRNGNGC
jgi:putative Holliday junction resolvase